MGLDESDAVTTGHPAFQPETNTNPFKILFERKGFNFKMKKFHLRVGVVVTPAPSGAKNCWKASSQWSCRFWPRFLLDFYGLPAKKMFCLLSLPLQPLTFESVRVWITGGDGVLTLHTLIHSVWCLCLTHVVMSSLPRPVCDMFQTRTSQVHSQTGLSSLPRSTALWGLFI